ENGWRYRDDHHQHDGPDCTTIHGSQFIGLRDGIDTAPIERMATGEPAQREPRATEHAVALDRLTGVLRARGGEAACRWQRGRDEGLIGAERGDEDATRHPRRTACLPHGMRIAPRAPATLSS